MRVGFVGLGNMGQAMARNLLQAGHLVKVWNRTADKAHALVDQGAEAVAHPYQAAQDEAVITMLADDRALEDVAFGPGLLVRNMAVDCIHISMSTIGVALAGRLAAAHAEAGTRFVSAPVLGRPDAAAAAKLFIVAAGMEPVLTIVEPLFHAIGQRVFRFGADPVQANVIKLSANFMVSAAIEAMAESMALVRKSGMEAQPYLDFLTATLFTAPVYRNYGTMVASDNYHPVGFRLPLGLKDNRLLLQAADTARVPMPLANVVKDQFLAALARGENDVDWAGFAHSVFVNAGLADPAPLPGSAIKQTESAT